MTPDSRSRSWSSPPPGAIVLVDAAPSQLQKVTEYPSRDKRSKPPCWRTRRRYDG